MAAALVPQRLRLDTGDDRPKTDGEYTLAGYVNGQPFWRRGDDRWLYSSPRGLWTVTDQPEHFTTGWGYVVSQRHNGRLPHSGLRWRGAEGTEWRVLPEMRVEALAGDGTVLPSEQYSSSVYAVPQLHDLPSTVAGGGGGGVDDDNDDDEVLAQAIREEEAAAQQVEEAAVAAEVVRQRGVAAQLRAELEAARGKVVTEKAMAQALQQQKQRVVDLVEQKNARMAELSQALAEERARAEAARSVRPALEVQSQQWRQAAQELMQMKTQMEAELQEVKELMAHRIREKERELASIADESGRAKAAVAGLTRELQAARDEAAKARAAERRKQKRIAQLEAEHRAAEAERLRQERLLQVKQFRHSELHERQVRECARAVEERIWGPSGDGAASDLSLTATTEPDVAAMLPSQPPPDDDGPFAFELDDELPPAETADVLPVSQESLRMARRGRPSYTVAQEAPCDDVDWPAAPVADAKVVESLAAMLRSPGTTGMWG